MAVVSQTPGEEGAGNGEERQARAPPPSPPSFTILDTTPSWDENRFSFFTSGDPQRHSLKPSSRQPNRKAPVLARWMLSIRKVLPRSDLPGARQPTPLNLNRYVLLLVYLLYIACTGVCFYGWPALAGIVFRNEGFASQCRRNPDTGEYEEDLRKTEGKPYICDEQDGSVQKLYTMTCAICSTMCAFAGALMDFAGPRWTAILGQMANLSGWLLLSFSARTDVFYYLAFTMLGLGADTAFLPTFSITRLFPGSSGLIITVLGSAVSASYAVPLVLLEIMETYNLSSGTVCLGYACLCPLSCVMVAAVFMPRRGFLLGGRPAGETLKGVKFHGEPAKEADEVNVPSEKGEGKELAVESGMTDDNGRLVDAGSEGEFEYGEQIDSRVVDFVDDTTAGSSASTLMSRRSPETQQDSNDTGLIRGDETPAVCAASVPRSDNKAKTKSEGVKEEPGKTSLELEGHSRVSRESRRRPRCVKCLGLRSELFFRQLVSERYVLIVLYKIGVVVAAAYFQQASRRTFSEEVVRVRGIILPFAFVPCIFLGKLADTLNITRVLFIINTAGICMYGFSFWRSYACGCVSVVFFTVYMSMYSSQIFVYVESTFAPQDFGKLGGLTLMIGGLVGLLTNPLYERVTVRLSKGSPLSMQIVMTIVLSVQFLWIARLYSLYKRDPHPFCDRVVTSPSSPDILVATSQQGDGNGDSGGEEEAEGRRQTPSVEEGSTGERRQFTDTETRKSSTGERRECSPRLDGDGERERQ